ncbi:hypothetical protein BCR44DRAFT_95963 [Catenaria anguillulae PL171]|uniref:Uncharacterized protein n=1 Tax=Catenaria anguillulae PL171 TaxID=765915 RepID=A0A1Y2HD99_9FUNG|nr:hypothetical protein BCR44DRAFT_95963 [Catenaria anguillulae PL171]
MGLHYIIKIRKEVSALRPTIATASLFQASADAIAAGGEAKAAAAAFSHGLVVVSTAAIPSSPSSPTLLIVPVDPGRLSSPSPIHTTATAGLAGNALDGPLTPSSFARGRSSTWLKRRKLKREKAVATGLCILLNMCIMVVFPIMHPYVNTQPKGTGDEDRTRSTSALFDSAFMLICQKLFAGTVTAAINQMTELVLSTSNNELQ